MRKTYKPLLPAPSPNQTPAGSGSDSGPSGAGSPAPGDDGGRNRRKTTLVACNKCRARKSACNGTRPKCGSCQQRGFDCVYATVDTNETPMMALKRKNDSTEAKLKELVEMMNLLRAVPEEQSIEILRQLRMMGDMEKMASLIEMGKRISQQLSPNETARSFGPPSQSSLEFELMVRNPIAYPAIVPLDALPSTTAMDTQQGLPQPIKRPRLLLSVQSTASGTSNARPLRVSQYCDPRLHKLKAAHWTNVRIHDDFAARAVSIYLTSFHPLLGFFDADLFLTDLIAPRSDFCSRLLQAYTAYELESGTLSRAFYDEARALWITEDGTDSTTRLASALLLHLGCMCYGSNNIAQEYLMQAFHMGQRMHLFEPRPPSSHQNAAHEGGERFVRASAQGAWGLYNWLTLCSFYFHDRPLVKSPPSFPIPGTSAEPTQLASLARQLHITPTFPAFSNLCIIIHDITSTYFGPGKVPVGNRVPLSFAESIYQRLLALAQTLDINMARGVQSPDHVIMFHMTFHCTIVHLFRPFIPTSVVTGKSKLTTFSSPDCQPLEAYAASIEQLKRLVYVFHSRYASAAYHWFWHIAITALWMELISKPKAPHWRIYLELFIEGLVDLFIPFRLCRGLMQSLLTMALRNEAITGVECQAIIAQFMQNGKHHNMSGEMWLAGKVFVDQAQVELTGVDVDELSKEFDTLILFDEFIIRPGSSSKEPSAESPNPRRELG